MDETRARARATLSAWEPVKVAYRERVRRVNAPIDEDRLAPGLPRGSTLEVGLVGGQAVIEGVMMRAPNALAVAVRREDGGLTVLDEARPGAWRSRWWARLPLLRGTFTLIESMQSGFRALSFAAEQAGGGASGSALAGLLTAAGGPGGAGALGVSLLFALGLFVGLPHALTWLLGRLVGGGWDEQGLVFHLVDGLFKLGIFVGYVALIRRIPEIARVFAYHGAEHKVVNAHERGRPMALDEVRLQDTFHARCGTSFILLVLVVSVAVFALVLPLLPTPTGHPLLRQASLLAAKILLMIPVAGLAYETNRYAARHPRSVVAPLLVLPGRWMQRLTTREPDDAQLEVALAALRTALAREAEAAQDRSSGLAPEPARIRRYRDFRDLDSTLAR